MKAPHSLHMGPAPVAAPAATATKFWNVASVSEDEGEITLYGDVMSQQPIDWWSPASISRRRASWKIWRP